jgi:hypothetical protein
VIMKLAKSKRRNVRKWLKCADLVRRGIGGLSSKELGAPSSVACPGDSVPVTEWM